MHLYFRPILINVLYSVSLRIQCITFVSGKSKNNDFFFTFRLELSHVQQMIAIIRKRVYTYIAKHIHFFFSYSLHGVLLDLQY